MEGRTWDDFDFLRWVVETLVEQAQDAKSAADKEPTSFNGGRRIAYYAVLNSIANRAELCEVPLEELGLDPEFIQSLIG